MSLTDQIKQTAVRIAEEKYPHLPEEILDYLGDVLAALPKPEPVAYADAFGNVITKATKEFSRNVLTNEFNRPLYATPPQSDDVRDAWQPIETAPKDEVVLAWIEYRDLSCARVGSFDLAGGFHIDGNARCTDCATHWMPLPEAPAIAAAKGEK